MHRLTAAQTELEEAGVGGIEHPESVKTRLYFEVRKELAVGEDRVAVDFGDPRRVGIRGGRIHELPFEIEDAIAKHEGYLVLAGGQAQGVLDLVTDQEGPEEARVLV